MELEREWTAQINRFLDFGLTATHFDSHHHVHSILEILPVIQESTIYGYLDFEVLNGLS